MAITSLLAQKYNRRFSMLQVAKIAAIQRHGVLVRRATMDRWLPSFSLRGMRIGRTAGNLDSGIEAVGFAEEI